MADANVRVVVRSIYGLLKVTNVETRQVSMSSEAVVRDSLMLARRECARDGRRFITFEVWSSPEIPDRLLM